MINLSKLLPITDASGKAVKQSPSSKGDALQILENIDRNEQFAVIFSELQNNEQTLTPVPQQTGDKLTKFAQNNILALLSLNVDQQFEDESPELLMIREQIATLDVERIPEAVSLAGDIPDLMVERPDFEPVEVAFEPALDQQNKIEIEIPPINTQAIAVQPPEVEDISSEIQPILPPKNPETKQSVDLAASNGNFESEITEKTQAVLNNNSQPAIPLNQVPAPKPVNAEKAETAGLPPNSPKEGTAAALANSTARDGAEYRDDSQRQAPVIAKEMKVTVLKQETHLAPPVHTSLAQQITDRIAEQFGKADTRLASQAVDAVTKLSNTSVKVLQIQLAPPDLGMLTMRMSLKADVLHLHLQVAQSQTATLIQNDREALTGLLRSAGYMVEGLQIQVTPSEKGTGGQALSSGNGHFQPGQSHSGSDQANNGMPGQSSRQKNNENFTIREGDAQVESRHYRPDGDAVYI